MGVIDELCPLLDELRKLACDINEKEIRSHSVITLNQGRYNRQVRLDMNHDWLNAWHAELERILQAIESALGRGECMRVMDSIDPFSMWVCDNCGHPLDTSENFCGGCGRKVKR